MSSEDRGYMLPLFMAIVVSISACVVVFVLCVFGVVEWLRLGYIAIAGAISIAIGTVISWRSSSRRTQM